MGQVHRLGDLQLAILRVLWQKKEATLGTVHEALAERGLAPTTIATMLKRMEERGIVKHRVEGRQFAYRAAVAEGRVHRSMVGALIDKLFGGDPRALVEHLVSEGEIDAEELDALRRQLKTAERGNRRG
jgi:predicted transcriptional regulator